MRGQQGEVLTKSAAYVLGSPVAHSLSPVLHRAAYASLGLTDWSYAAREVDEPGFAAFVAGCGPEVRGLSLTMPLKEIAFTVADQVSDRARQAGAINTLVRTPTGWAGDNTDIAGIRATLGPARVGERGLILGAGATARSALIALHQSGAGAVVVAARDPRKAAAGLRPLGDALGVTVSFVELTSWVPAAAALTVSTLPPAGALVAADALTRTVGARGRPAAGATLAGVRLLDVVYADWPTPLARAAAAAGAQVHSGLEMLVHQAVLQVELMTGARPDPQVLLAAGQAAVAAR